MGGTIRFDRGATPGHLDVLQTVSSAESSAMGPIYDALIFINLDFVMEPMLAESWEVSADGKTITLNLVQGVKFHDGTTFDAAAVKNDLDWKLNEENKFEQRAAVSAITNVEVVGDYAVKLTLSKADALVMPNMAGRPGFIYSPTDREARAPEVRNLSPVGAGSFKVVEFIADDHYTMERWGDNFSGGMYPFLDRLEGQFISDPAVRLASFRAGDLDLFAPTAEQAKNLTDDSETVIDARWQEEWPFLNLNPRFEPMADIKVRQAIAYAIDRKALNQALELGEGAPRYGTIGPAYGFCYDESYRRYEYDPEKAKSLLAEAGLADGFTTAPAVWFGKQGLLPRMNLLADQLRQVGITLDLQLIDSIAASRGYRIEKKYGTYSSPWGSRAPDIDTLHRDWFYSKAPGFMFEGFLDAAVIQRLDTALDNGKSTFDPQERCGFYREAQDIINDHALGTSLYTGLKRVALKDFIKGFVHSPSGGGYQFTQVWLDK